MRNTISILVFIFLLIAFSIGSSLHEEQWSDVNQIIDNASITMEGNISNLQIQKQINSDTLYYFQQAIYSFSRFVYEFGMAIVKIGIKFGMEHPEYFEPDFILLLIKIIIFGIILSATINPLMTIIIMIILGIVSLINYLRDKKNSKEEILS